MADFISAFERGIKAAEAAEIARREIDEVFLELNKQMLSRTGGKISIGRRDSLLSNVMSAFNAIKSRTDVPSVPQNIDAWNPGVTSATSTLASWVQDRAGYPCTITWGKEDHTCLDRAGLESALESLLSDPVIGAKLRALMRLDVDKEGAKDDSKLQIDSAKPAKTE